VDSHSRPLPAVRHWQVPGIPLRRSRASVEHVEIELLLAAALVVEDASPHQGDRQIPSWKTLPAVQDVLPARDLDRIRQQREAQ